MVNGIHDQLSALIIVLWLGKLGLESSMLENLNLHAYMFKISVYIVCTSTIKNVRCAISPKS